MSYKQAPKPDGHKSTPASSPPELNHYCRARRTGVGDFVACLEPPPHDCGYSTRAGDGYLCLHPHQLEFAAHTEARQQA